MEFVARSGPDLSEEEIVGFFDLVQDPEQRLWDPGGESLDLVALRIYFRDVFASRPGQALFLAKYGGSVAGMSMLFTEKEGCLGKVGFGVKAQWQSRGIGARLLAMAVARAREEGLVEIRAEVLPHNLRAIGLLIKTGFEIETPAEPSSCPQGTAVFRFPLVPGRHTGKSS